MDKNVKAINFKFKRSEYFPNPLHSCFYPVFPVKTLDPPDHDQDKEVTED